MTFRHISEILASDWFDFDPDHYRPHMLPKVRSERIREAAAGMPCTLRIASLVPSLTCADRSTTVLCHLNSAGKGMSTKSSDTFGVFGCKACHDILDGVDLARSYIEQFEVIEFHKRQIAALHETQALLIMAGILSVQGGEITH